MKNFSSLASAIDVKFKCVECGSVINETIEGLPIANIMADNTTNSENSDEEIIICPNCDKEYTCSIYVNPNEGNIEVSTEEGDAIEDIIIESIFNED